MRREGKSLRIQKKGEHEGTCPLVNKKTIHSNSTLTSPLMRAWQARRSFGSARIAWRKSVSFSLQG